MDEYEKLTNSLGRIRNYEKSILLMNINYPSVDLKKFTQLESIRFEECKINTFVNAPNTLKKLVFIKCKILYFENLPDNLEILVISNCACFENNVHIPMKINNLPNSLKKLACLNSLMESLDNLPTGLEILYCDGSGTSSLDYLPTGLRKLSCKFNSRLTRLDFIPNSLEELYCDSEKNNTYHYIENLHEIKQTYPNLKIKTNSDPVDLYSL